MSKSKYNTIKELPFAWYEVDALEAWLDEQSRQGLKMVDFFGFDFGRRRAVFMETNELPTRYRIHIKPKDGYYTRREEYKETMRELGWEYVGQLHYRADIYRPRGPTRWRSTPTKTLCGSPSKPANRGELCAGIVLILLIPWLLRNELRYMKFYDGFYDMLLDGTALLTAAAVFMAVFYLVLGIYAILRSIAQRRRYLLDRSFRPGPEIHKRKLVRIALMTLVGISVMFLLVLGVGAAGNYYDVPLSNCPVVMLESLSPEEAAQLDYNADRLDAPHGTGGKSLLYSFATYRQDGPTVWFGDDYPGWAIALSAIGSASRISAASLWRRSTTPKRQPPTTGRRYRSRAGIRPCTAGTPQISGRSSTATVYRTPLKYLSRSWCCGWAIVWSRSAMTVRPT